MKVQIQDEKNIQMMFALDGKKAPNRQGVPKLTEEDHKYIDNVRKEALTKKKAKKPAAKTKKK